LGKLSVFKALGQGSLVKYFVFKNPEAKVLKNGNLRGLEPVIEPVWMSLVRAQYNS